MITCYRALTDQVFARYGAEARLTLENDIVNQVAQEIARTLIRHKKVLLTERDDAIFFALEVIVPEPTEERW